MRIVTFNIHGWRTLDGAPNLDALASALAGLNADIIGLNEVFYPGAAAGARAGTGDSRPALEALAARLDMHFVFGACLRWPAERDMPADAFGNAVLSRWPIIASSAHHLTSKEEDPQRLLDQREQRGLLEARILLPDQGAFTVYVTHLDHTDEEVRSVQLRVARTWLVRDRSRPHLVLGDFNAVSTWDFAERVSAIAALDKRTDRPDRSHHGAGADGPRVIAQMEKAGYVDLYRRCGQPGQATYLAVQDPPLRIDYIFANQPLLDRVRDCFIWTAADGVSDHRPVVADLAPEESHGH